jgi:hypothetical protein
MIYLASPYSHPDPLVREWRFRAACKATGFLIERGSIVFSPIVNSHPLCQYGGVPADWQFWDRFDLALMRKCDAFAVLGLPGWRDSKGIEAEMSAADGLGMNWWLVEPKTVGVDVPTCPQPRTPTDTEVSDEARHA